MKKPIAELNEKESGEFSNLVALMAIYSEAENQLATLASEVNGRFLEFIDEDKDEYAQLQETLTKTASALEIMARSHPEWFQDRKSIKTPYGTVKLTPSTKLEVANEKLTLAMLESEGKSNPNFNAAQFTRTEVSLNLEALERLDDATLKRLRINRVRSESFKVDAAKVDLGKAVKEAAEKAAA